MKKLSELLRLAELFYKRAMQVFAAEPDYYSKYDNYGDDEEEGFGGLTGHIPTDAQKFDIKDEELYNQFESLMNAYSQLMGTLNIDSDSLNTETMEEAAALIDVLNTRYERIMSNPYLNASDNYAEDFDPGDLTSFIQNVVNDAEDKLKSIAGDDVSIDEVIANQYAQEFNQQMIDKGDKNVTYTGNKVQQLLEARRNWFKNLMFIKRVGKSHPEYSRYEKYIEGRHKAYQNIMADPERKAKYRERVKERFTKWFKTINEQKPQLEALLERTIDPKKKEEILNKLQKTNLSIQKHMGRRKKYQDKRKALWEAAKNEKSLPGLAQKLRTQLDTTKSEIAKKIKSKAAQDPYFKSYKETVQKAKDIYDNEPSPENKRALEASIKQEAEAITKYLNEHAAVVQVRNDLSVIAGFKDQILALTKMESSDETAMATQAEYTALAYQAIELGQQLVNTYAKIYKSPMNTINDIVQELRKQV